MTMSDQSCNQSWMHDACIEAGSCAFGATLWNSCNKGRCEIEPWCIARGCQMSPVRQSFAPVAHLFKFCNSKASSPFPPAMSSTPVPFLSSGHNHVINSIQFGVARWNGEKKSIKDWRAITSMSNDAITSLEREKESKHALIASITFHPKFVDEPAPKRPNLGDQIISQSIKDCTEKRSSDWRNSATRCEAQDHHFSNMRCKIM